MVPLSGACTPARVWAQATPLAATTAAAAPPSRHDVWAIDGIAAWDVDVRMGVAIRLDTPPLYPSDSRTGLLWGAGVDAFLSQRLSLGLAYEHIDLGREDSGVLPQGTVRIERDLNSAWARLRIYPYRTEALGLFGALGLGLTWQSAQLDGSVWPRARPALVRSLRCEGAAGANVALRGEVAMDAALGDGGARLQLGGALEGYRLSDAVMAECAPGAGSASLLSLRLTLIYGTD